jgi:hypothetical protein
MTGEERRLSHYTHFTKSYNFEKRLTEVNNFNGKNLKFAGTVSKTATFLNYSKAIQRNKNVLTDLLKVNNF